MGAEPIFIDTNILIYANNRESDFCESARDRLYELADNVTSGIKDLLTYNTNDFIAFREITVHSL